MKHFILLFAIVFSATGISAERFYIPYASYIQKTPFSGVFSGKRILATKVVYTKFDANGQPVQVDNGGCSNEYYESYTFIHHDSGGLIDTIDSGGCVNMPQIFKYSADGKLRTWELSLGTFTDFDYDEQGRIFSVTSGYSRSTIKKNAEITSYDYDANLIITESITDGISSYSVCRIHYTDSGYVAEYEDGSAIKYVYDEQHRLIRGGNILYTYTESGYIKTEGEDRTEFVFEEENGYLIETKVYKRNLDDWIFTGSSRSDYIFSPLSNEPTIHEGKVYGAEGVLVVDLLKSSEVMVYSLKGQLVVSQWIQGGEQVSIRLPEGFYVIHTDYGSHKAFVK